MSSSPATIAEHSCVTTVVFDAMFTTLQPKGRGRRKMIGDLYREAAGLDACSASDARIWRLDRTMCVRFEAIKPLKEFRRIVNTEVFRELLQGYPHRFNNAAKYAVDVRELILTSPDLYYFQPSLATFIKSLRAKGIRVVIGSNQQYDALMGLLRHPGMVPNHPEINAVELFDAVYTSEKLGFDKPDKDFWLEILNREGVKAHQVLHIGNSLRTDTGAAEVGIQVVIYDRGKEFKSVSEEGDFSDVILSEDRERVARKHLAEGRIEICHELKELRPLVWSYLNLERSTA
ncbi:HAD family hydrolase [Patescibacteria group bacterium]|nr:HAD family hydrolase [Patescibacteria group bacterium]